MKTDELNDMTKRSLLRMKYQVEIIMEVLDDEAAPTEEVCVESEEEEKWNKLKIIWKEVTRIYIQRHE